MSQLIGSIITDCSDDNVRARQELRFTNLFGVRPTFTRVGQEAPGLEAGGHLLDQLDVLANNPKSVPQAEALILVNVAPRGGKTKEIGDNGTPFCYFRVDNALVVCTAASGCLDLVHWCGAVDEIELLDIPTVTKAAVEWGELTEEQANRINNTQFRSLEFLPLVAYWLRSGKPVPSTKQKVEVAHDTAGKVWYIDNFGNAKTTLVAEDIGFEQGKKVTLADGLSATCYRRLADVPKDESALTIGSSGYRTKRFLEVVVQWHEGGVYGSSSAYKRHGMRIGSSVLLSEGDAAHLLQ